MSSRPARLLSGSTWRARVPANVWWDSRMSQTPQDEAIVSYWESVRAKAKIARLPVLLGTGAGAALPPSAWSFGDSPALADQLLQLVLDGVKTGTSSALAEYGPNDALPAVGELSIILDGAGNPRALLRTTAVDRVRFEDVTADFAAREGEDDRTLESWRREHETYWRRVVGDEAFSPSMDVLCETFELIDPTE